MQTYNHIYLNDEDLQKFIDEFELHKKEKVLVRVHSRCHTREQMTRLLVFIGEKIPNAKIIGCSAMQIICDGKLIPDACLISVSVVEKSDILTARIPCKDKNGEIKNGHKLAREVVKKVLGEKKGILFIFFPLSYGKMEDFVNAINKVAPNIKMIGGAAYLEKDDGGLDVEYPYVIEDKETSNTEVAMALIYGEDLHIYGNYVCGVEPVGKKCIAQSDGKIIKSVDGIDGAKWYSEFLGEEELKKDGSISHTFPLVKSSGLKKRNIAYYVDYLKDDTKKNKYILKTFAELKDGSELSMGYFHPDKIYEQVSEVMNDIASNPSESIFAYDCQSRAGLLHGCASWELGNFHTTNISGALLSGEIASNDEGNIYANYTFVISSVSESDQSYVVLRERELKSRSELQEDNVRMLNYLLANANKTMNEELQKEQKKLQNAVFYNLTLNVDNHLKFLFDKEREKLDKVAIVWLNNLKMLRIFVDSTGLMNMLQRNYEKIGHAAQKLGMKIYSYGDCSLMVAAGPEISDELFMESLINIKEVMESVECEDIPLVYNIAVVEGEEDTMKCLEQTLKYAIEYKKPVVRFEEIKEEKHQKKDEIHLLKVVREAITHHRVVPYFQEIYDNYGQDKRMYESLMRIEDGEGKVYFPNDIIPIAKEYELYESISEEMVHTVIEQMRYKDIRVTINLNVQDIYNRKMLQMIFSIMRNVLYPENFVFEIVESEEVRDYAYIQEFADRIHELGCQVAIDDFGSGFSNILHILKIKADYIKIDGEIIRMIENDEECLGFMKFINDWCIRTGKEVIAEYVENEKIQKIVKELGVRYSQGYYFSKPHRWGAEDGED